MTPTTNLASQLSPDAITQYPMLLEAWQAMQAYAHYLDWCFNTYMPAYAAGGTHQAAVGYQSCFSAFALEKLATLKAAALAKAWQVTTYLNSLPLRMKPFALVRVTVIPGYQIGSPSLRLTFADESETYLDLIMEQQETLRSLTH
jgi:signal transduction histidine kinase